MIVTWAFALVMCAWLCVIEAALAETERMARSAVRLGQSCAVAALVLCAVAR